MINIKRIIKKNKIILTYFVSILILSLIFTFLEFIGLPYHELTIILLIINILLTFIFSYKNGTKESTRGYKSGIKSGLKIIFILIALNILTLNTFNFKTIIYYTLLILFSIIAGILGKNKQKNYSS